MAVFIKIAGICVLIALLHVPLVLTRGVLVERQNYREQATEAIASGWGHDQQIVGPILAVPYAYKTNVVRSKVVNGKAMQVEEVDFASATAYFLPDTLEIDGALAPEIRHRGIYDSVIYLLQAKIKGSFRPDFAAASIDADRIDWDKARVYFGVGDLRGVRSVGALKIEGAGEFAFESAGAADAALLPLVTKISGAKAGETLTFSIEAAVQGSRRFEIAPVGKNTKVALESSWPDPSFIGAALPATREVRANGFRAEWQSSHLSRGFGQTWTNRAIDAASVITQIEGASFGVRFAQPVDGYSMVDRAQKYGILFFVLLFAVFFLFEITSSLRIHPLQYALVGAALCLFFIGFLALTEFWSTGAAYATAAAACTAMVSLYARTFLKAGWRTLVITGGLGATYGYLYFVLKSQDYALVAGTAALFAALALVMFCTRRLDWYRADLGVSDVGGVPSPREGATNAG
jgi:inner membrane protein